MNDTLEGIVLFLVAGMFVVFALLLSSQQRDINRLEKQMCAWIIWEDGSASPRTDDFDRFKCREGK